MKKVLMIAYFFPPLGGSGVQRTLKYVKYLPEFGVQPIVSTVCNGHNFAYDETLLQEIPDVAKVYRSNSLETLWIRNVIEKVSLLRGSRKKTSVDERDIETTETKPKTQPEHKQDTQVDVKLQRSLKQRVFDIIDNYLFVPDSKVRWLPFGFLGSLNAARKEKVDYIYSSSYPYTVHLIALLVKKFYNKPWIADFRDPWVGNEAMAKNIGYRQKIDRWLERKVVKNATYVVNVTDVITQTYKERYPEYADKFMTITNGFDPADFRKVTPYSFEKFTLIHTGILSKRRSPAAVVQGLEQLVERRPELRYALQVLFVGSIPQEFEEMFQGSTLSDMFEVWDYVPHHVCLDYLAGSQLLLLIFDDSPETKAAYSGKIFDYIGTEKPILGVLPEGIAAELIREKGIGSVIALGDGSRVADAIETYYDQWVSGETVLNSATRCSEFSRVNLSRQLAELMLQIH